MIVIVMNEYITQEMNNSDRKRPAINELAGKMDVPLNRMQTRREGAEMFVFEVRHRFHNAHPEVKINLRLDTIEAARKGCYRS